jgi:hypothetical protein
MVYSKGSGGKDLRSRVQDSGYNASLTLHDSGVQGFWLRVQGSRVSGFKGLRV